MNANSRRDFVKTMGALAGLAPALRVSAQDTRDRGAARDVAVIGAGVFGTWTAYHLCRAGQKVALVDAYGPGSSRASSGGETRVIRMAYGDDEIYTRFSWRSLGQWQDLAQRVGHPLFHETGVLWMAREKDPLALMSSEVLARVGVPHDKLARAELEKRYPQVDFGPITWAIWEPKSGVLMARRSVYLLAQEVSRLGGELLTGAVATPRGKGRLASVKLRDGRTLPAGAFVFACGPWLPKLLPELLGQRIFPTRQEVYYFGSPMGDVRFQSKAMPVWADFTDEIYGIPDFRGRGFKVALDRHGPVVDPDSMERVPTPATMEHVREFVRRRFPALGSMPIVEAEVCQYENTSNGDFLVDRHPELANVWLVGGGSGHGFKHGPAMGEYVAARIADGKPVDARFSLATKQKMQQRTVF
jgi:monomeric sarcosine oxidase